MQKTQIPSDLELISVGTDLLNGKEYYRLSNDITESAFNRIKLYFEDYSDVEGEFSGWLTAEPVKVEAALKLTA